MQEIVIQQAAPEDAEAVLTYMKRIGSESDNLTFGAEGLGCSVEEEADFIRGQLDSADRVIYLAKLEGAVIGDASLERLPRRMSHRGELGISVVREHWGNGVGSALLRKIVDFAAKNGFEQIDLEVRSDNLRAIRLYEKFGFQKLCTFPAFFKIEGQYFDFDLMILQVDRNTR